MKKIIYLLLFFAIARTATAQTVYVPDVEVLPGGTAFYSLTVNVGGGEYLDFGYDIVFPRAGFTTPSTDNNTVNPLWIGGTINVGEIKYRENEGGIYRGRVGGLNLSPKPVPTIPTGDFEIGSVAFTVADDVPVGEYDVIIRNFDFTTATTRARASEITFKVKVVNVLTVVLDENSTTAPEAAEGVNVLVKRTIAANEWGTICLPFAMSAEQVTAAFGSDVKLCNFMDYETQESGNDIIGITLNFESAAAIEANHPYIIKVSDAVTEFTVSNVDIAPDEDAAGVEYDNGLTGKRRQVYGGFYGTYQSETEVPMNCLFLSGGKFYYSKGLTKMKAFRGYFDLIDVLSSVEGGAAGAKIGFSINGGTTAIGDNNRETITNNREGWYTLDGIKLNGEPTKKGIYIYNGKKVVKK